MTPEDDGKQQLLDAVNLLIRHPAAHSLFESMRAVMGVAQVHPVRLTGEAAPLNVLIGLHRDDPAAFERVLDLVETKRMAGGYDPLLPRIADRFDKATYMREFMASKRERQRRAARVENLLRPEKDALRGRARLDFMDRQSAKWKIELDERIERARKAQGGRLAKEVLETIREQFWQHVDRELDELEALAREEIKKSPHSRGSLGASMAQLADALKKA